MNARQKWLGIVMCSVLVVVGAWTGTCSAQEISGDRRQELEASLEQDLTDGEEVIAVLIADPETGDQYRFTFDRLQEKIIVEGPNDQYVEVGLGGEQLNVGDEECDNASDAICIVIASQSVLDWVPADVMLAAAEALGEDLYDYFPEEYAEIFHSMVEGLTEGRELQDDEPADEGDDPE